jgi:hypothetical protein
MWRGWRDFGGGHFEPDGTPERPAQDLARGAGTIRGAVSLARGGLLAQSGTLAILVSALLALLAIAAAAPANAPAAGKCATPPVTVAGPCGMDFEDAFSHFTSGNSSEVIAYIEGGINWHISQAKELVDSIYVNWHELPVPCTGSTMVVGGETKPCKTIYTNSFADYDVNHDGVVNAEDWANDPRVHDSNGNGYIDPEDLIAAFSDGVDHDHDGYVNDISGWDFYDNQNDPATEDSTYEHSDDQMLVLHRECPKCMIMPIRAGNEALDTTDSLAKAWLFAGDAGANVIVSVTADLGYSSFMREAISSLESKGVAMLESSNDFDSTDHQGGMFWPYVIPGNGALATSSKEAWTRSDLTSWGAHNVLTGATTGGSTSESTPTLGGAIALLQSYGQKAAAEHLISSPLTGPEAEQVLISTAKRITEENLPWPGGEGEWNPQYGYGIPNVYSAIQAVAADEVPPVGHIDSPSWYSLFDPTITKSVAVKGTVEAPRSTSAHYLLQAGLGGNPQSWFTIGEGTKSKLFSGLLGTLNMSSIPESFWAAQFGLSKTKELESAEQFAVTLRLTVTDASGRVGVDRRAINVTHDPSWIKGFPLKLNAGGESQPALVDLQGTGRLDAVFGDSDGFVHAIDPKTHKELPGWPVHTNPVEVIVSHEGINPGYEPIISDVAVGDLEHNGNLSVIASTDGGKVFVWNAHGRLESGWPQTADTGVTPLPIPRPADPFTRLPLQGAAAGGPVLFDLGETGQLDVIEAGWDGYLHVWQPDGENLRGWPVKVQLPKSFKPKEGYDLIDDQKLESPPTVAYLEGRSKPPDLVVRPQYTETKGAGIQESPIAFAFAYHSNATKVSGWPVKISGTLEYYGSAQEFITEGSSAPVAAKVTGGEAGADDVAIGPQFTPPSLISGEGKILNTFGAVPEFPFVGSGETPVPFTSTGAFGKLGGALSFAIPGMGVTSFVLALVTPASGDGINELEAAFPATGGTSALSGFPTARQGIDFLGEPIIAPVTASGGPSVVDGGDTDSLQASTSTGAMAEGFPKWTTGWNLYSPAAGDLLSNGHTDIVSTTREGYLFAWSTNGPANENNQWWRAQHDEWNSGNYEAVTRPPGVIRSGHWEPGASEAKFTAPGSTWYQGTPSSYQLKLEPQGTTISAPATVPAGSTQKLAIPAGTTRVGIQAVGPTGLLGQTVFLPG